MAALAAGGALGTLVRYGIERAAPAAPDGFPWATLVVNVTGAFLLGVVVTLVVERWPGDRFLRPLLAVGFCGGFTTFSTLAVEIDQRIQHGHSGVAAAYLGVTLVAGLGAALAGITLARGRLLAAAAGTGIPDPDLLAGDDPADEDPAR
jgi:CrcB protein